MEKEFVSCEIALALKELGFDEPCFGYYHNKELSFGARTSYGEVVEVPTFSQSFRFFREKYQLHQIVLADEKGKYDIIVGERISGSCLGQYSTYEEAELECLKKLIEIVKK